MKAALFRFGTTENPVENGDRCAGWRPLIIESAGEPQLGASFDRESSAIRVERAVCDELGAHPSRSSAPDEVREARPQPRWGVAKRGTDGPARCSSSMSRGVMDGATANSPPQTAAGRDRMTRPSRRSSSRGAARGFWIRAWGQREPAIQGTGRSSCSAEWLGWLEGGLDIPAKHAECGSLQREHPLRTLTRFAWSRTGRVGNAQFALHRRLLCEDALPVVPQPIEQDPGHSAVPTRDGRPFSRSPNFVIDTKGRAFRRLTTRYRTTSRPRLLLSQGPNSTGAQPGA
jgi:hypothetical protein